MANGTGRDPYVGLLQQMRRQGAQSVPPGVCLGTVLSYSTGAIQIRTDAGLVLEGEDLQINAALTWDAEETAVETVQKSQGAGLNVGQEVQCDIRFFVGTTEYVIDHMTLYDLPGTLRGTLTMQNRTRRLQAGDRVLMQPTSDGQLYYVICKVVGI